MWHEHIHHWIVESDCNSVSVVKSTEAQRAAIELGSDGLAGALHEVSNALTVVLGWLEEARTSTAPGSLRDALDVAYTHARLGHAIARRAVGAETEDTSVARTALGLAREAALGVSREAARRNVEVVVDETEAHDVTVPGAPSVLQVLMNLLLNAIAFSPDDASVRLGVVTQGDRVRFSVEDRGPGVPVDRIETLFTAPASTRPGGAGIGLWHANLLASSRGGELRLAHTGRTGTCFELCWPTADAPSGTIHRPVAAVLLDGVRVVALEDDLAVLSLIDCGLTARGARVVAVSSLEEVERVLARGVFDVALVDLSPIGSEPTPVLRRLAELGGGLPVVVISGSVAPDVASDAVAAWVRKPFEVNELAEAIARVRPGT
jgi:CheY-like chemotaxis protein